MDDGTRVTQLKVAPVNFMELLPEIREEDERQGKCRFVEIFCSK
jgi:hypothetical protein